MQIQSARDRAKAETRDHILDVAIDVLGQNPDAGMGDVASAAGVVRRTVYSHFPSRTDLVRTLAQRAVDEISADLNEVNTSETAADTVWVRFMARLWPLTHRYRVLIALRRGEYGQDIHALLRPVDETLADIVQRGQDSGVFGHHLPADLLSQITFATAFSIADRNLTDETVDARAATITSLLVLGVPETHALTLIGLHPHF